LHPEISLGNFVKNETQKWLLALVIFFGFDLSKTSEEKQLQFHLLRVDLMQASGDKSRPSIAANLLAVSQAHAAARLSQRQLA
jgi:hypothetical protein